MALLSGSCAILFFFPRLAIKLFRRAENFYGTLSVCEYLKSPLYALILSPLLLSLTSSHKKSWRKEKMQYDKDTTSRAHVVTAGGSKKKNLLVRYCSQT